VRLFEGKGEACHVEGWSPSSVNAIYFCVI